MAIYYLDADDEVTSAAAHLRDSSDERIGLVLSNGSRIATSRINFRLLAREARHRHKRLAIITTDRSVQAVVRSAELAVFGSVGEYERAEADRARGIAAGTTTDVTAALDELALTVGAGRAGGPGKVPGAGAGLATHSGSGRPSRVAGGPVAGGPAEGRGFGYSSFSEYGSGRPGGLRRFVSKPVLAGFGVILILVLAASAFFFYPSATVTLTLHEQPVGPITLNVKVDPAASAPNDLAATVPGVMRAFPVSVSGTFDATGQRIDETAATGSVTFTSKNTFLAVPVLAGTQVSTADGVAFVTTKTVTVPTANFDTQTPGRADAPVTAVQKGTGGNVAAARIVKLPSDLVAAKVSVSNKSATAGGTHAVTAQIAQADLDNAQKSLAGQLTSEFGAAVGAPDAAPAGSLVLTSSAHMGSATCSPDPGSLANQDGSSFDLTCSGSGTATVVDIASVKALAERRVKTAVKVGFSLVASSVAAEVGTPVSQGNEVVIPVTVQAAQVQGVDIGEIRAGVKGKSLDDAKAFVAQYGTAEISVSPDWASTMPSFDFRIDVQLVLPPGAAAESASPEASSKASRPPVTVTVPPRPTPTPTGSSPASTPSASAGPSESASMGASETPSTSPAAPPSPSVSASASAPASVPPAASAPPLPSAPPTSTAPPA